MLIVKYERGGDVETIRDAFVEGFTGEDENAIQIDEGAYSGLSYSVELFSIEDTEYGAFTLFRAGTDAIPTTAYILMSPRDGFGEEFASAQAAVSIAGEAIFTGVGGDGLKALLDANAGQAPDDGQSGDTTPEARDGDAASEPDDTEATSEPDAGGDDRGSKFGRSGQDDDEASDETPEVPTGSTEEAGDVESWTDEATGLSMRWANGWEEAPREEGEAFVLRSPSGDLSVGVSFQEYGGAPFEDVAQNTYDLYTEITGEERTVYGPTVTEDGFLMISQGALGILATDVIATSDPDIDASVSIIIFNPDADIEAEIASLQESVNVDGTAPAQHWNETMQG